MKTQRTSNISQKTLDQLNEIRKELLEYEEGHITGQFVYNISASLILERGFSLQSVDGIEVILKHEVDDKYIHIYLSGRRIRVFDGADEVLAYGSCNVLQPGKVHDLLVTTGV